MTNGVYKRRPIETKLVFFLAESIDSLKWPSRVAVKGYGWQYGI